jgi:hypothetical protein
MVAVGCVIFIFILISLFVRQQQERMARCGFASTVYRITEVEMA